MACRWIKAMEGKMGLRICKPGDASLVRTLEACIRLGQPLLVEQMGPSLEPQLLPLLEGNVTSLGHRRSAFTHSVTRQQQAGFQSPAAMRSSLVWQQQRGRSAITMLQNGLCVLAVSAVGSCCTMCRERDLTCVTFTHCRYQLNLPLVTC